MAQPPKPEPILDAQRADPRWFRGPSRREHWIACGLFIGFGVFFTALFFLHTYWWFRWVILGLGVFSIVHGLRHMVAAIGPGQPENPIPPDSPGPGGPA